MWGSQRAYVDPGGGRATTRGAVTQRSEPPQPRLLGQTCRFFDYFESIEFDSIRATIMPLKVCEIVSAQKLIRAREGDGSWAIERPKSSIFLIAVVESNLHIFGLFLKRWSRLSRLYNCCHRKYRARARLVEIRGRWRIDRRADDASTCQGNRHRDRWERHLLRWRSRIKDSDSLIANVLIFWASRNWIDSTSQCINFDVLFVWVIHDFEVEVDELLYSAHLTFT